MSGKALVRVVSGVNAGTAIWIDIDRYGPRFRVPKHPDLTTCDVCAQGDEIMIPEHYEDYRIYKFSYATGHRHYFAAPGKMREVDFMNVLWNTYQDATK